MAEDKRADKPGVTDQVRLLLASLAGLIRARSSLAVLELADARDALLRVLFMGAAALLLGGFALACLSALLVAVCWEALGWRILLILFVMYAGLALALLQQARQIVDSGRVGLPATLEELSKDRAALFNAAEDDQA